MRFHRDVEYALISLSVMIKERRLYSARELSGSNNVPYGLLCKILQRLSSAQFLESIQGPKGGYRLAVDPEEVSLSEIMDAVHGEEHVAPCLDEGDCGREGDCTIRPGGLKVQSMWDNLITRMTLAEFVSMDEKQINEPTAKEA